MSISFAIHGTPGKSECWGMPNSETYLKSYYDEVKNASEQTRLDIDFRVVDNTVCSFYHYLKLKNISNGIARSGGYFGMSIRFEGTYCLDVSNLFKMLNQLYEQVVCKSILQTDGTNAEYVFSTFKQCQAELENIKALATNALDQFKNDIREFPQNYSPRHGNNVEIYNIQDTGSESFRNVLFRDAEVYVSPEYPLLSSKMVTLDKDNKEKSEQIKEQQGIISNQKGKISSLSATIDEQRQTINRQNAKIDKQSSEITQKAQEIAGLEKKLESSNHSLDLLRTENTELAKKLKEALGNNDMQEVNRCISMLNAILENRKSTAVMISSLETNRKRLAGDIDNARQELLKIQKELKSYKSSDSTTSADNIGDSSLGKDVRHTNYNWKTPASVVGLIAVLALIYFLVFGHNPSNETIASNPDSSNNEFVDFKKSTEKRFEQIDIKLSSILRANSSIQNTQTSEDTNVGKQRNAQVNITWINLKGASAVKPGGSYSLAAQTGESGHRTTINGGGHFKCPQATISNDNGSTCDIKVNDNASGSIKVEYIVGNQVVKSRNIDISQ